MNILPTQVTEKKTDNPKNLIIFGLPKVGKTTALSQLPNNLIIDLESGSDYVSGYIVKANTYVDLFNVAKALKTEEHNFKFVTLDTVTALEDIALELACKRYKESPVGKNWEGSGKDILKFTSLPILRRLLYLIFSYSYPMMNLYFKIRY